MSKKILPFCEITEDYLVELEGKYYIHTSMVEQWMCWLPVVYLPCKYKKQKVIILD